MLLPTLLSASTLAFTANAFLVPPSVGDAVIEAKENVKDSLANLNPISHENHNIIQVSLDCKDCPYALASNRDGKHEWIQGPPNSLELDFSVDNKQLILNGVPLSRGMPQPILAQQSLQESADRNWAGMEAFKDELRLSYSLEFGQEFKSEEEEVKVTQTTIKVLAIDDQMVEVDSVVVYVVDGPAEEFEIDSILVVPSPLSPAAKACGTIFCRVMAIAMEKMQAARAKASHAAHAMKACLCRLRLPFGFARPHTAPPSVTGEVPPFQPHGHHHHGRPFIVRFIHGMKRVMAHVLLPVAVGMAAGMAACAVGMVVGQAAVWIWGRSSGSKRAREAQYVIIDGDAKEELPPMYEELDIPEELMVMDEKTEVV